MAQSSRPRDTLHFPESERPFLEPYLPPRQKQDGLPFVTVTYACSLDSQLALSPGAPTALSGPPSKAMTHYLRSRHDAILIGVGTAVADNPSLNCRIQGVGGYGGEGLEGQPRPIILDPTARWDFAEKSKIFVLAGEGRGKAPYIITGNPNPPQDKKAILEKRGGKFITLKVTTSDDNHHKLDWKDVLDALAKEGLGSVMVEGGGSVINSLLTPDYMGLISSVIVTIAPTWLGQGGVRVSPARRVDGDGNPMATMRLRDTQWRPFGEDVVLCGYVK